MKILFVSSHAPFRDTRFGGSKRLYYLARELDARADLQVISLDGCHEIPPGSTLPPEFKRQLFIPRVAVAPVLEQIPFLPGVAKSFRTYRRAVADFLGDTRFDATLLAFPSALRFLDEADVSRLGKITYLEDDLLLENMRGWARTLPNPIKRLFMAARYAQARRYYHSRLKKTSAFVCITSEEERVVHARWPGLPTRLLGYGIPLEHYPVLPPPARATALGFIGNYRHRPNLDAIQWLVNELFPAILAELPEATLVLCGANFPGDLRKICARNASIRVLDEVDDLATFYDSISIFVNPLREGRGLRTKVIEAAAFGRPVLSTPLGAEGLENFELGLFESKEELVARLREITLADVYARAAARNRAEVERDFSMRSVGDQLMKTLSSARAHGDDQASRKGA